MNKKLSFPLFFCNGVDFLKKLISVALHAAKSILEPLDLFFPFLHVFKFFAFAHGSCPHPFGHALPFFIPS